ncbi:hypothetical protein IAQ61_003708 [Plenodomus lingam]|uniref:Predicted protein n=1 Tax=Leptosphaeria maculans (strain JN3 / isolate v23.1.3 / race Av1-4-5-6-7-8) TaxID=985895 RepID=E4ZRH9_LEPMJ|nr:predicted protein [Plenodomus lingam JN3]KAH9874519.1 hypothetical protein IAQ61_003708 [Plenodomus lingam]CBX93826.1 predicted protein [Plenodomus lingam JN3]
MYLSAKLLSSLFLLWRLGAADKHHYCACVTRKGGPINVPATLKINRECSNALVLAQDNGQYWYGGHTPGPRHAGIFLSLPDKSKRLDGDYMHNLCKAAGAPDSACFNCDFYQEDEDGGILCQR